MTSTRSWRRRRGDAPETTDTHLVIARRSWKALHRDLLTRGGLRRESGAFLLAAPGSRRVTGWIAFDDLDPTCLTGGISLRGIGFSRLWDLCGTHGLSVIADVHTHPGTWVDQSPVDAANPMIGRPGHIALISPDFARTAPPADRVGVHVYHGSGNWTAPNAPARYRVLVIRRFARPARALRPTHPDTESAPTRP